MRMKKTMEQHSVNGVSMANGTVSFRSVTLNVYSFAIDGIIIDAGASALKTAFSLSGNNSQLMLYIAPISMKTIQAVPLGLNNNCMFRFTCTNLLLLLLRRLATTPLSKTVLGQAQTVSPSCNSSNIPNEALELGQYFYAWTRH